MVRYLSSSTQVAAALIFGAALLFLFGIPSYGQQPEKLRGSARKLRGALNPQRTCYDVHHYALRVRIFPEEKTLAGQNRIAFTVREQTANLQIDLFKNMQIDSIHWQGKPLEFSRKHHAVMVHFPTYLEPETQQHITVWYRGKPKSGLGAHGDAGFHWEKDKQGRHWVGMMVEHIGASLWYPNKDHLSDEPDSVWLTWEVPDSLGCLSNGTLERVDTLEAGWIGYNWRVHNPIDNYNITFYLGNYRTRTLPYRNDTAEHSIKLYVLDYESDENVLRFFKNLPRMLHFFESIYGEYPFWEDGLSMIQAPFRGMEHQGCLNIGKDLDRPVELENWSYPDITSFYSVVAHELAHEWWGNALSVDDMAEVWLQEGFATYSELLFIEHLHGEEAYLSALGSMYPYIRNEFTLVGKRDRNANMFRNNDVYYKGALVLHKLREEIADDTVFFRILRTFQERYRMKTTNTSDLLRLVNEVSGKDYTAFLNNLLYK